MEVVVSGEQGGSNVMREYRKGNWTVQETMVLIEAKRMDDERRMRRQAGESSGGERGKPTELRWKWVEDYCWSNGCLRSQNQCNDKWDNLMRDFKKVREYERRVSGDNDDNKSYWKLERNERKENNLPTNMLREIYEALVEVVDRKGQRVVVVGGGSVSTSGFIPHHHLPPPMQQQSPLEAALPLPPPPPPQAAAQTPPLHYQDQPHCTTQPFPRVDPDTSEHSDSPAKRRRMGEGTSGTQEVGPAISRSAALIAEAIQSCEEREERRHRELLSLHERRLQIEESKAEINRQGINGLVDAINRLANSILTLATNNNNQPGAPPS
ncbi:PREDICTED: trihelix transcription factor ASR3-like isoform X2 [Ipomoea nil]|uniref:trihelix transcription factor ASR3-like isoform X2 n=1 Tax=Ipomoea nil TaxID=35883 RepID=UPI000901FEB0|nr:PREDICTED: trihelix transcription factor ASR3-like isoform X2 [Ipomoea nil]